METTGTTLGERFEASPNALNFLRLCLAIEVIVWHAYALRGSTWLPGWAGNFIGSLGVDGFFAISGFLICRSWVRRPQLGAFLLARARRLLPGLWVSLLVTAFVIAPVATHLSGTAAPSLAGQLEFVRVNADTWPNAYSIDGSPAGLPDRGWNGSLWSLGYESACYLAVAALGVLRLLNRRVTAAMVATLWLFTLLLVGAGVPAIANGVIPHMARTGLMFACGAGLYFLAGHVPVSRRLASLAALLLPLSVMTPNYRLLAAPTIAYLCLYIGLALGRFPRLVLRHDLSYGTYVYAFPLQQAMLLCGVSLGWLGFTLLSVVVTLPVAAASWWLIERPCQGRRRRSTRVLDERPAAAKAGLPGVGLHGTRD